MEQHHIIDIFVYSFSFLKTPLEAFHFENGGGHEFDCRCLQNPGREGRHKELSGLDQQVILELDAEPMVAQFMEPVMKIVNLSLASYRLKGYSRLSVGFGCTGGQHRSVFCAELCAKRLRGQSDVNVSLRHIQLEANAKATVS
jgi:RNase adaptor protein for sRNA GlmZ degradation